MSVASNLVTPEVATAQNITNLIEAIKPGIEKSQGQPGDKLGNTCKPNI
ncbi:hypothetical protein [Sphaerospermopsis aphanizomenoides]|nr:hypothetical protein [Sphaerospermopsis aphanizomenoides]